MKSGQRGSTLVEFAFAGLLLFIALFAALEFARWMYLWNSMTEATRRGARVAAVCPINDPAIARVTVFINPFSGTGTDSPLFPDLDVGNVAVEYLGQDGSVLGAPTYDNIKFVRVSIQNYSLTYNIPLIGAVSSPPFSTTLAAESLGRDSLDDINSRSCF
ncbi:TadE/TadG family type IV pilus assembly protein [Methylogaea oryzae]|uniref:TadE-like domain-containing protein n=1 Tax=Methylogaea oryzae TaxID=1295382 RepID=A0A8D5AH71_9GAMM|nr:TadE family protein [Methylogaea oryzae]BBL69971.1 hypothetical protein MoryE10_05770 [Methylogaea oryzae]